MKSVLKSLNTIRGFSLGAIDGQIGQCQDFLIDESNWAIRYMVADTRKWLPGDSVLISPISLEKTNEKERCLELFLTKNEIKSAPPLTSDLPVSRRYELIYNKYFSLAPYWNGGLTWGEYPYPHMLRKTDKLGTEDDVPEEKTNLRSANEIMKYKIEGSDGSIGHVEDLVVDSENWVIRYLIIDTSNWIPGSKRVILSPEWVSAINWGESRIHMDLTVNQIKNSPEYDPDKVIDREYEKSLYDWLNLPYYW